MFVDRLPVWIQYHNELVTEATSLCVRVFQTTSGGQNLRRWRIILLLYALQKTTLVFSCQNACFKAKVIQRWVIVAEILRTWRRKAKFIATKSPFLSHFARSNRTFIHSTSVNKYTIDHMLNMLTQNDALTFTFQHSIGVKRIR